MVTGLPVNHLAVVHGTNDVGWPHPSTTLGVTFPSMEFIVSEAEGLGVTFPSTEFTPSKAEWLGENRLMSC